MTSLGAVGARHHLRRRCATVAVAAGFAAAGAIVPAAAASLATAAPPPAPTPTTSGFDFGVAPYSALNAARRSAFRLDAAVGRTLQDRVAVINSSDKPKQFWLYAADAYTAEIGGAFALRVRADMPTDAAAWISLPVQQYTVPPRTASVIPFSLAIPSDATPGDHTAGIVAEEVVPPGQANGATVTTIHRVAARVYLRVDGPIRPALHVDSLVTTSHVPVFPVLHGQGASRVTFYVLNTGNVRIGLARIRVSQTGVFGRTLHARVLLPTPPNQLRPVDALPSEILPGGKVRFVMDFRKLPPLDHVTTHVTVNGADAVNSAPVTTVRTQSFWAVSWVLLAAIAAVVTIVVTLRRRRRGTRHDDGVSDVAPDAVTPEALEKLPVPQ